MTPVHGMVNAAGIMHYYSHNTAALVAIAGAATMSADGGHDALHEHAEQMRYDILVCFGKTWQSVGCERLANAPEDGVGYHLHYLFGSSVPTIVVTVPSAVSSWWADEDHVIEFVGAMEMLVANRVMALNECLHFLQANQEWMWN